MTTTTCNTRGFRATGAVCFALFLIANLGRCQAADKAADAEQVEPPFPGLVTGQQSQQKSPTIKLVTETIVKGSGITTQEEYLDLNDGKAAYVLTDSQEIVYSNARETQLFRYKPYTCQSILSGDPVFTGTDDWSIHYGSYDSYSLLHKEFRKLRLFGVAAMWLWAESRAKVYSRSPVQYELSKEIYNVAHIWAVDNPEHDLRLEFHFVAHSEAADAELSLQSVKLISRQGGQLLKSINVLSIDYYLSLHIYENLLSFPVGYDCVKAYKGTGGLDDGTDPTGDTDKPHNDDFWSTYVWSNSRVTFEVTATKMEELSAVNARTTDTMVVEIAHARIGATIGADELEGDLLMTRVKSSQQETKTVMNHLYSTVYHIDSQRGTCSLSHLTWESGYKDTVDEFQDNLSLKFSNDLKLNMHKGRLQEMFSSVTVLFKPVKTYRRYVGDNKAMLYQVLERPTYEYGYNLQDENKYNGHIVAREMQTLSMAVKGGSSDSETQETSNWKLESHTIWLLDAETQSKILATFHLNVIDEEADLDAWPDQASLFDISEECYLNEPSKKSGRDYAWVDLLYPIASRQMDVLIDEEFKLKQSIYDNLLRMPLLSRPTLPRLELMFSDEGLIVRILILDVPSVDLIYDSTNDKSLPKKEYTQEFTLPDVTHCAKMCQMYSCLTMTYCSTDRVCLISAKPSVLDVKFGDKNTSELVSKDNCITYGATRPALMELIKNQRLSNVIGALQHQDYDNIRLPATPDEVALPREETGLDEEGYRKALRDYIGEITKYLEEQDHRLPLLTITLVPNGHFVAALPTKFTVENDPLDELALDYSSSSADVSLGPSNFQDNIFFDAGQIDKFFHVGRPGKRFDVNKLVDFPLGMKILQGVSYDQCAVACLDSKCGTFGHCTTSNECVLTNIVTMRDYDGTNTINDSSCLIMARDFVQNFQKFPNVLVPDDADVKVMESSPGYTANDCAIQCIRNYESFCMSFEFCDPLEGKPPECYVHDKRHPESIFTKSETSKSKGNKKKQPAKTDGQPGAVAGDTQPRCDHYERSYLAEFTHIEGREIVPSVLAKMKTTENFGETTFACADICLNQMADCSAFQFCYEPEKKRSVAQTCTFIQSMLENEEERKELEVVVDTANDLDKVETKSSMLAQSKFCQLFALKPNSLQAHLRNLAMGETKTTQERDAQDHLAKGGSGYSFTWFGLISLIVFLMVISTLAGYGFSWARVNNEQFRSQVDRVRILVRL